MECGWCAGSDVRLRSGGHCAPGCEWRFNGEEARDYGSQETSNIRSLRETQEFDTRCILGKTFDAQKEIGARARPAED
jgi:hypothetical protein